MPDAALIAKYEEWRSKFPQGFNMFAAYAQRAIEAGAERIGAQAIVERMRWDLKYERPESEQFKINNSYRSLLARELMDTDPRFAGKFETRRRRLV